MMSPFFPKTTRKDLILSLFVIIGLSCSGFIPTLLGMGGLFFRTPVGIVALGMSTLNSIMVSIKLSYNTRDRLSDSVIMPSRTLGVLFVALIASWIARNILNLDPMASRVMIVLFSSLFEFVSIFFLPLYTVWVALCFLGRKGAAAAPQP